MGTIAGFELAGLGAGRLTATSEWRRTTSGRCRSQFGREPRPRPGRGDHAGICDGLRSGASVLVPLHVIGCSYIEEQPSESASDLGFWHADGPLTVPIGDQSVDGADVSARDFVTADGP